MMCPECGKRPVKRRGRCAACYKRHLRRRTHYDLPTLKVGPRKVHTDDDCPVCDEVAALSGFGCDSWQIADALHMTPEAVDIHVRRYSPHLADITRPAALQQCRERKRKATV